MKFLPAVVCFVAVLSLLGAIAVVFLAVTPTAVPEAPPVRSLAETGSLGISLVTQLQIPTVNYVVDGTPAAAAGIKYGDVFISIAGVATPSFDAAKIEMLKYGPDDTVNLRMLRDDEVYEVDVMLISRARLHELMSAVKPDEED